VLVPFLASLFLRGTDFESQMELRLRTLLGDQGYEGTVIDAAENTHRARVIEFQRLLAPVMGAQWCLFHRTSGPPIILNDRGWVGSRFTGDVSPLSYAFPLSPNHVLGLRVGSPSPEIDFDALTVAGIGHAVQPPEAIVRLNNATAGGALSEVYGSDPSTLRAVASNVGLSQESQAYLIGAGGLVVPDADLAAHQFDWYGLVADLRAATNVLPRTSGWPFIVAIDLPKPEPASRFLAQLSLEELEKAIESGDGLAVLRHLREALDEQPRLVVAWLRRRLQLAHFGREGRDSQFDAYRRCLAALGDPRLVTSKRLAAAAEAGLIECGRSRFTRSQRLFERAIEFSPDRDEATLIVGLLFKGAGQVRRALKLLEQATRSDRRSLAAEALVDIGETLRETGQLTKALEAFATGASLDEVAQSPIAAFNGGRVAEELGQVERAESLYRQALGASHEWASAAAAINLAQLVAEQDRPQARELLEGAANCTNVGCRASARLALAQILEGDGERDKAALLYRRAANSRVPQVAPYAAARLGHLLAVQKDIEGARQSFLRALQWQDERSTVAANLGLGQMALDRRDFDDARSLLTRVLETGDGMSAGLAAARLGWISARSGDLVGAAALYARGVESEDPSTAAHAADSLARTLFGMGDAAGAAVMARRARESGDESQVLRATVLLGSALQELKDLPGAREAYGEAIASGHPRHASLAICMLAGLEIDDGDEVAGEELLAQAQSYPGIGHYLSSLLLADRAITAGYQESARGYYDEALRSDDRGLRAEADLCLGYLLTWQGDGSLASHFFRAAVGEEAPPASTEASEQLQRRLSREAARQLLLDPPKRRLVFGLGKSGEDLDRP